ncbi:hypothetical protein E1265_21380 [Streptomyces sp. 8K308]|uniref:hypothetical protein n=1 Tax=Streptomyces sp. 8K308 TaxID=2530388 RepID=UPI00104DDC48|nr:hypothetical protein [Streptomyces sp. 8K308]TDC20625.1 hypothetical protein E1265_21380 [Streptomyces sp. 8K308]
MKASLASMLRWLVLPWGKTSGRRIVLDGQNGGVQIYDDSNTLVADLGPDVNADSQNPAGLWTRGYQFPRAIYSFLGGGIVQFGTVTASAINTRSSVSFSVVDSAPRSTTLQLTSGAPIGTTDQAIVSLTSRVGSAPAVAVSGVLTASNIATGLAQITPVANSPTSLSITGLNVTGSNLVAFATALTAVPGSTVIETSVNNLSNTSLNVWVYRTNTTTTGVYWMVIGR